MKLQVIEGRITLHSMAKVIVLRKGNNMLSSYGGIRPGGDTPHIKDVVVS